MIGGRTIAEAYVQLHNFQMACEAQVMLMAAGTRTITQPQKILDGHINNYDRWLNRPGGPRDTENCLEWNAVTRMLKRRGVQFDV